MPIYETDELTFEVPEGYIDRTMNIFVTPPSATKRAPLSIVITRDARTAEPVGEQAGKIMKDVPKVPGFKVLGQRDRAVGSLPAREARIHGETSGVPTYARQTYVGYYDTLISIIVTAPRASSAQCDAVTERLLGSMRFKKSV
ncbi:MAG: DcrB-related protein [Polyangiaceae bacterium]|nr:DcrB-related protein [Polyangiaceae bacterium]NUQ77241.1 DcrB-related protein [Polyangiaceae bacterium]